MIRQTKSLIAVTLLSASYFLVLSPARADVETMDTPSGTRVTKIKTNGRFVYAALNDGETNGFLNASKDEITNTSSLDFSYAFPNPTNPDYVVLIQGAGEIPNSALNITATSARLLVTTPFPVIRCDVNLIDATFSCDYSTPSTFDLAWSADGFGTVVEKIKRTETQGPVSIKSHGEYSQLSAKVIQRWDGHFNADGMGNLLDTRGLTLTREVSIQMQP